MLFVECSPPVKWRPKFERPGAMRRWQWLWFAVAWWPGSLNKFIRDVHERGFYEGRVGYIDPRSYYGKGE